MLGVEDGGGQKVVNHLLHGVDVSRVHLVHNVLQSVHLLLHGGIADGEVAVVAGPVRGHVQRFSLGQEAGAALAAPHRGHVSGELRAVPTADTLAVEVPELPQQLPPPGVAQRAGHVPSGDLLPRLDPHLGPHLQLQPVSLDVVGVADACAVDQTVDGVEDDTRALLEPPVLQLHPVGLQYPDTSVDLSL